MTIFIEKINSFEDIIIYASNRPEKDMQNNKLWKGLNQLFFSNIEDSFYFLHVVARENQSYYISYIIGSPIANNLYIDHPQSDYLEAGESKEYKL